MHNRPCHGARLHLGLRLWVLQLNVRAWQKSGHLIVRRWARKMRREVSFVARPPTTGTAWGDARKRLQSNNSGAAAIEFAIVLSLFVVLALGTLAYGIYLGAAHGVSQLAADAARASVAGLTDAERITIAREHVERNATDFLLLSPDKLVVEAAPSLNDANQFQVVVRYDAADLPIWFMSGLLPLPSKTIVRSASIKRGGY